MLAWLAVAVMSSWQGFVSVRLQLSASMHRPLQPALALPPMIPLPFCPTGEGEARGVEGQVQQLLQDAQNPDSLCRMYIGCVVHHRWGMLAGALVSPPGVL